MGQTTSEEAGKKAEQLEDRSPTPTPTDVLMEEEEEEEAKKTGEEKGKEKEEQERRGSTPGRQDTETAEAEGGRKGAEEGGGGVAKEPEGVKRTGQKRRAKNTGAGEEEGQREVVERRDFSMKKHLEVLVSTIGEDRGVKAKVNIEADTCLGEYKGKRTEGTAPDCLTGRGDRVVCIEGGGADSRTGRGVWVDGGRRGNTLSRINAGPRPEDCDLIIHLDDGTPRAKAGTELALFYGVDYPLPPSPPRADAADPDDHAAEGSNQPVSTTQNILPSASALPAGQLYADDGSLVGRQYFSSKVTYPSQGTVTHVDGGQFIVKNGDRVRLLWSEMGGHLTQVESRTCCFKMDQRKGRFVRPLTTVWGDQNFFGGGCIMAGSRLAGVYPP